MKSAGAGAVGIVFLAVGGAAVWYGYQLHHKLRKYGFDNTTSGGVVEFKDYNASLRHNFNSRVSRILMGIGIVSVMIGMMIMIT